MEEFERNLREVIKSRSEDFYALVLSITKDVCSFFGVSPDELMSKKRLHEYVRARFVLISVLHNRRLINKRNFNTKVLKKSSNGGFYHTKYVEKLYFQHSEIIERLSTKVYGIESVEKFYTYEHA